MVFTPLVAWVWGAILGATVVVTVNGVPRVVWPEKPAVENADTREGRWVERDLPDGGRELCYVPVDPTFETHCREIPD